MRIRIRREMIHHFIEMDMDDQDNPIPGTEKDVLSMNLELPDLWPVYVYGIRVDFPITKQKIIDAIKDQVQKARAEHDRHEAMRVAVEQRLEMSGEVYEFDVVV